MSDKHILLILDRRSISRATYSRMIGGMGGVAGFKIAFIHVTRYDNGPPIEVIGLDDLSQADHDKVMELVNKYA